MVGIPKEKGSGPVAGDPGGDADGCRHGDQDRSPCGKPDDIVLDVVIHPEAEQRGVDGDGDGDVDEAGEDVPGAVRLDAVQQHVAHLDGDHPGDQQRLVPQLHLAPAVVDGAKHHHNTENCHE